MRLIPLVSIAALTMAVPLSAQAVAPELQGGLEVKWMRDSEEYAALTRMVYRVAERSLAEVARRVPRGQPWAVVIDIDETALDNSAYQLSRLAYRLPFDTVSWNDFVRRGESGVVPGTAEFVVAIRRLGGQVAWITNRSEATRQATQANMAARGLWHDSDRMCLSSDGVTSKVARRAEVITGNGPCGWGRAVTVVGYIGDSSSDFPQAGESDPDAGNDAAFGVRFFMLPNPMYGSWVTRVTRRDRQ